MLTLCYIFPGIDTKVVRTKIDTEMLHFETWLHTQVEMNPQTIFFFTMDTTDIFI